MRHPAIATLACLTFACTTVRAPAGSLGAPLDREVAPAVAEPQVELVLESGDPVTPEEAREAEARAREALAAAIADRRIDPHALGAGDPLLVLRVRGVVRTPSRRSDQRAAVAGMVVGFVVVVAAVVILIVTSKGSPKAPERVAAPGRGGSGGGRALAGAPTRVRVPARAVAVPGRAVPSRAVVPRPSLPSAPAPVPYRATPHGPGAHGPQVFIGFNWVFPLTPPPPDAPADPGQPIASYPGPYAPPHEEDLPPPPELEAPEAQPAPEPARTIEIVLPPLPEVAVEERGFFDGELAIVGLDLVDRSTGAVLWSRVERADADPRDAKAMRKLVGRALAGQPWVRETSTSTP